MRGPLARDRNLKHHGWRRNLGNRDVELDVRAGVTAVFAIRRSCATTLSDGNDPSEGSMTVITAATIRAKPRPSRK